MKTKNVASELLYQLAATGRIDHALKQYGLDESTTQIAFVRIPRGKFSEEDDKTTSPDMKEKLQAIISKVEGRFKSDIHI